MLEKLRLRHFKSWVDTGELPLGKITGFFGTNSSGKSSILQFLLMLKETVASQDRASALDFGGEDERHYVDLGSLSDISHKSQSRPVGSISWSIVWSMYLPLGIRDPENPKRYLFKISEMGYDCQVDETANGPAVNHFSYSWDSSGIHYEFGLELSESSVRNYRVKSVGYDVKANDGRLDSDDAPLISPVKCYGFPDQLNAYFKNAGFLNDFSLELTEFIDSIYYLGPLREYPKRRYTWSGSTPTDVGRRGQYIVNALLASRSMPRIPEGPVGQYENQSLHSVEEFVGYWLKALGLVHSFRVAEIADLPNSYLLKVRQSEHSDEVLISEVGFGVSQVLPVITLCYYVPERSIILFEQPEIHLHPSVQMGLADVFIDAAVRRNVQIVIESHSEHLLTRLQRRMAEEAIDPGSVPLYFCERPTSESKMRPLELDDFGNITNWPTGFFGDEFEERAAMTDATVKRMERSPQ